MPKVVVINFLAIMDTIEEFVKPYIDLALGFLDDLPIWVQALSLVALVIFAVIGIIMFIKKFFKAFLVLAILGVVAYILWDKGVIQNLIDKFTASMGSINGFFILTIIKGVFLH